MTDDHPLAPAVAETAEAIEEMEVRGAAAIARAAAGALSAQAEFVETDDPDEFRAAMCAAAGRLAETRPTAVSLPNALRYVLRRTEGSTVERRRESARAAAREFRDRLETAQADLGAIGANRLRDGDRIMTHCHSTDALACVRAAVDDGKEIEAIVKETRPRKQGHITARELREMGVPVTLVVDGAARRYLDDADHVLVGADSIAADGSVINKIGTSGLAVVARERGVPITVAAGTIKIDPATLTGRAIEIEERDPDEVLPADERRDLDVTVENPAFDVTPPRYVDAIVTERGQFPPESIVFLLRELFGESVEDPWDDGSGTQGEDE